MQMPGPISACSSRTVVRTPCVERAVTTTESPALQADPLPMDCHHYSGTKHAGPQQALSIFNPVYKLASAKCVCLQHSSFCWHQNEASLFCGVTSGTREQAPCQCPSCCQ